MKPKITVRNYTHKRKDNLEVFITKWMATFLLIVGNILSSFNFYPQCTVVLTMGSFLWLIVACVWKEKSLIILNILFVLTGCLGIWWNIIRPI